MTTTTTSTPYRQKLIEVALPLDEINAASAREKSIRHGHPSTLHLWWARRPLAACRAVLFASLVDDPSADPRFAGATDAEIEAERERLFVIIRDLVKWENSTNETVLAAARAEIMRSTDGNPPPVLDPFCGGGSIPLEAQRLGLEAHGSDLNPVAVLITKALIEIPPKFAGRPPVNPVDGKKLASDAAWPGAKGLAADVRHYGQWMRDEAERRIGYLYPKAKLPDGSEATVIAWLWARSVRCPNPACGAEMPLVSSFVLSSKVSAQAYLQPVTSDKRTTFEISSVPPKGIGDPKKGYKRGQSGIFECSVCGSVTTRNYVAEQAATFGLKEVPTAVVAEGKRSRFYLTADASPLPENIPTVDHSGLESELSPNPRDLWCRNFGLKRPVDLFTRRQLVALTTFSDLTKEVREFARNDALLAGLWEGDSLSEGGHGANAYADAIATYLGFALSKMADRGSSICTWFTDRDSTRNTFARQAIPMTWDFAELNVLLGGTGSFQGAVNWTAESLDGIVPDADQHGEAHQANAVTLPNGNRHVVSTDPPYYDNIGYADLSDFFYVWLRRSIQDVFPELLRTLLVPKAEELIAAPYRHGGDRHASEEYFERNLRQAFTQVRGTQNPAYPMTVYYAFKQAESESVDSSGPANGSYLTAQSSTGWETMLTGLMDTGFEITGTWPMRTELSNRMVGRGTNVLASSIVIVCRMRPADAPVRTRRDFLADLQRELPGKLIALLHGNIAPVDLAQSAIGPGMAIFSRYQRVLEADGSPMRVRAALQEINRALDRFLEGQGEELDPDTRFCIAWFAQHRHAAAPFGSADVLARAKDTSVRGLEEAGVVRSEQGKVRLLKRDELDPAWDPAKDIRVPAWQAMQQLILAFDRGGSDAVATLIAQLGPSRAAAAKDLAYRIYSLCDRNGWAEDALPYDGLVRGWADIHLRDLTPTAPIEQQATLAMND